MTTTLNVNEIFPSFQGEGLYTGIPCVFLRLNECNLNCTYCDEDNNKKPKLYTIDTCINIIKEFFKQIPLYKQLVITGGEPLLQYTALKELCTKLYQQIKHIKIHIETNATIHKMLPIDHYTLSPKILEVSKIQQLIKQLENNHIDYSFKFVITLDNIQDTITVINKLHTHSIIYLQPETSNRVEITNKIIECWHNINKPFLIGTQIHKFLQQK